MMLFQTISALSLLLSSAVAAPRNAPAAFDVMALRSASPIHFAQVNAASRGLFLNLPQSNATCEGKSSGYATFYIENEELVLYSTEGEKQKVFVDRSGMGQGVIQYITGDQGIPRYAELKGWAIDANQNLVFKGEGFVACPDSIDGAWSIWLGEGLDQPGGNTGCLGFTARTLENKKPVGCEYTQ
ncbi:uncharacterized protein TrAFT101_005506 [Trichoderma asperellum]|uniref:Cell wall protein PhiA n=1 Tax=Trichoderma asperellum (strain ATCC 204424 / CBS 433.97 / NBRC 101777) TaxID=1042311 RepID=A0A2T3YYJ6_TRIA4|nr:hypothetical protein M441DRAFT_50047 [Trichoderma asperellum CBS 433.97]PTB37616.1 hypothetical protein M441DRAFT_50047 [Trichoderma asperellum CBS 433.97]UKZ90492.1 hypothetical protein TrAFT101_005506 [Trichoderma asperellum]WVH32609.1 hypothetical protein [Trichoderma asperellum]